MKSVYLLVLVSLCQGLPLETKLVQLAAPNTVQVTVTDPSSIKVSWNKIASGDAKDPVIGYKVKMWKVKNVEIINHTVVGGQVTQSVEEAVEPMDIESDPSGQPYVIYTSAKETKAMYVDLDLGVTYEIRVQAVTKNGEGPSSGPVRIALGRDF